MLLLTTLRRYEALEQILAKFLHKKISGKDKKLYYVLLLGAAEILYLNTPEYAAINEYVNIAKKYTNRFAVGMVNAVLRQINKQKNSLNTAFKDTYFSNSFKQLLAKDYTKTQIIAMEKMVGTEPPLDISSKQLPEVWAKDLNGVLLENGTIRLPSASKVAELAIEIMVGPEVLTGSTRLKAGTAQKLVLNMISTATMVCTGKCYQNLMVDVVQSNEKLHVRAQNIVMEVTGVDRKTARNALDSTGGSAKKAIVVILGNCSPEEAEKRLVKAKGHVRAAIQ